jgi:dienelactone hydrolase
MRPRASLIGLALSLLTLPGLAHAAGLDGEWMGAFENGREWVFVTVSLGGEDTVPAGRIDLPLKGERRILLRNVSLDGRVMRFEVPGTHGPLRFDGRLEGDRIEGHVRQGLASGRFELLRSRHLTVEAFRPFAGTYEIEAGVPLLVYFGPQGAAFVDHRDQRMGTLYATGDETFVSGRALLGGYPVEATLHFERVDGEPAHAVVVERKGLPRVRATRRSYYRDEPVRLQHGDVSLAATLLVPNGRGPFPAVVLIQGSGTAGRDALLPFADAFARRGVAVLFHDRRGTGQSTGSLARATFDDLAGDALAGVGYLARRPEIDHRRIGLHGASLGGWVAPLAATRSPLVSFIIAEAVPTTTPEAHERLRVERQMQADGFRADVVASAVAFMDEKGRVGRSGEGWDALVQRMEQGRAEGWLRYTNPPTSLESLQWNWRHVMSFDPVPVLEQVRVPVLALFGELDTIVSPALNRTRLEHALARAGNRDVTVRVLPGANHHFLSARTGGPGEVPTLEAFVDGYFPASPAWLESRGVVASTAIGAGTATTAPAGATVAPAAGAIASDAGPLLVSPAGDGALVGDGPGGDASRAPGRQN